MRLRRSRLAALALALGALVLVTFFGRAERYDACIVCGVVRSKTTVFSIPIEHSLDDTKPFTAWVRAQKPDHHEHCWVYSHTETDGEVSCSKSPLPYVLSGLWDNCGATPEVASFLDTVDEEARTGTIDEPALIARSDEIRREYERRKHAAPAGGATTGE